MKKLYSVNKAADILGLHPNTVRRWADEGIIPSVRTKGGHRRVDISERLPESASSEHTICYCRVSSRKQKDDLDRQIEFMQQKYPDAEIIKDIGSGLNCKRRGLRSILERLLQGDKLTVVVAYRDRLARFGADTIEFLINKNGGKLVVLNEVTLSPEEELTRDLLTILHVFSCRMHGLRRYHEKVKEDKALFNETPEKDSD